EGQRPAPVHAGAREPGAVAGDDEVGAARARQRPDAARLDVEPEDGLGGDRPVAQLGTRDQELPAVRAEDGRPEALSGAVRGARHGPQTRAVSTSDPDLVRPAPGAPERDPVAARRDRQPGVVVRAAADVPRRRAGPDEVDLAGVLPRAVAG